MKKIVIIFSLCVFVVIFSVFAKQYFISSYYNRHLISEDINAPLVFHSDTGDVDISQLDRKYVVLYFWDSTNDKENMEKDHRKFREICESRIKNDERVKIFAVRRNPDNVSGTAETTSLEAYNIHVPSLSFNKSSLLDQLKINVLPTVLIIDSEYKIKFRGSSLNAARKCILALTFAYS